MTRKLVGQIEELAPLLSDNWLCLGVPLPETILSVVRLTHSQVPRQHTFRKPLYLNTHVIENIYEFLAQWEQGRIVNYPAYSREILQTLGLGQF